MTGDPKPIWTDADFDEMGWPDGPSLRAAVNQLDEDIARYPDGSASSG